MDILKFVWLCGSPLIFFISFILLIIHWKVEIIRLPGLYAILPGINMAVVNLISSIVDFDQVVLISAITDFIFIVPIVLLLRKLHKKRFFAPWLLLAFEIFRSVLLILYYLGHQSKLTYIEAILYYFYFFVPFTVLLYSIFTMNKSKGVNQITAS